MTGERIMIMALAIFGIFMAYMNYVWEESYKELRADYIAKLKPESVAVRVLDDTVWILVDEKWVYKFPGACPLNAKLRTEL
jgi:hypothetical protein